MWKKRVGEAEAVHTQRCSLSSRSGGKFTCCAARSGVESTVFRENEDGLEYSQLLGVLSEEAEQGQIRESKATWRFTDQTFVGGTRWLGLWVFPSPPTFLDTGEENGNRGQC